MYSITAAPIHLATKTDNLNKSRLRAAARHLFATLCDCTSHPMQAWCDNFFLPWQQKCSTFLDRRASRHAKRVSAYRFVDLAVGEQAMLLYKRLGDCSRKIYMKVKGMRVENQEVITCKCEVPFYIDIVRRLQDH
jgi:hypothetical protein